MWGGNPPKSDAWTVSLLTNSEVLDVDQHSTANHMLMTSNKTVIWTARPDQGPGYYVAVFNMQDSPQTSHFTWKDLPLPDGTHSMRDLWEHKDLQPAKSLDLNLPPHGCILYRVSG